MSDDNPMIRWELDALKTEYNQHWSHFRHTIDKSYQAFNIHMVMMALLFSAVSLATDQASTIAVPLFVVVSVVAFASFSSIIQMILGLLQAPYNWTVIISLLFTAIPLVLGLAVVQIVHSEYWETKLGMKIALVIIGIVALFVWAGLYVGPLLVTIAGLVPLFRR